MTDDLIQSYRDALECRTVTPLKTLRDAGIESIYIVHNDPERVARMLDKPNYHAIDQDGSDILIVRTNHH